MEYTITLSKDMTYIVQCMQGEFTAKAAMAVAEESHEKGRSLGINHYLVDARGARNVDSTIKNYEFAYTEVDPAKIDRTAVVALLVGADDTSHDFVETVLRNAGYNVTLFRNLRQAERHLRKSLSAAMNSSSVKRADLVCGTKPNRT